MGGGSGTRKVPVGTYYSQALAGAGTDYVRLYRDSTSGELRFEVWIASSKVVNITYPMSFSSGASFAFTHIAVAGKKTGSTYYYYLFWNGNVVGSASHTAPPPAGDRTVCIGAWDNGASITDTIGYTTACYLDEIRVSNSARWTSSFTPPSQAYGTGNITDLYIGSPVPLQGIKFTVGTANATAGTMTGYYWNGTGWTAVSSLSDGTASGGVPFAQTGSVTFTSTTSTARQKVIDDTLLYWYKISVTECDVTTTISRVTLDAPFQQLKEMWAGEYEKCMSFQVFQSDVYNDYTANVFEDTWDSANTATYANLDALPTTGALYVGFLNPQQGIKFGIAGGYTNTAATVMTVSYWDGDAWVVLSKDDQTIAGAANNVSFGKSGTATWEAPGKVTEFKTFVSGAAGIGSVLSGSNVYPQVLNENLGQMVDGPPVFTYNSLASGGVAPTSKIALYYYKITFDAVLAGPSDKLYVFHVGGIPAQENVRGYKFPVMHGNSLMLCNNVDSEPNAYLLSEPESAQIFNGSLTYKGYLGDRSAILAGKTMYYRTSNEILKLTTLLKADQTWAFTGDTPESYTARQISDSVGIIAPLTLDVTPMGYEVNQVQRRPVAIWLSQKGVVMFDGNDIAEVSNDIRDKFDPLHANYIGASTLATCTGWIDAVYNEYHLIIPGSGEWVYDLSRKKWFQIDRASGAYLYGGFRVISTTGIPYSYGWDQSGYLFRLENGTAFNGNAIVHTIRLADIAPEGNFMSLESFFRGYKIVMVAKNTTANTVSASYFADGATSGISLTAFSPAASGKRIRDWAQPKRLGNRTIFHSLQFSLSTSDETVGFEPLMVGLMYEPTEQDIRVAA